MNRGLVACLLVALLAAPLASAQLPSSSRPILITAADAHADALAGASATFALVVKNTDEVLAHTVSLEGVANNTPGWTYDFAPLQLTLEPGASNNTTLVVNAPTDAKPGNVTLGFRATETSPIDGTRQVASNLLNVTITILPPPPAPEKPAPKLALDIAASSARAGATADGLLTIVDSDATSYRLVLSIAGPFAWHPTLDLTDITVYPSSSKQVAVHAIVPADALEGTTQAFTLRATTGDTTLTKTWVVTALAAPAAATPAPAGASGSSTSGAGTGSGAGGSGGSPTSAASAPEGEPTFALMASPVPSTLDAPAGESITATVRLQNTGNAPLHLKLLPRAGDGWPVRLSANEFDLAAGSIRDVRIEMDVPRDIVPGGTAQAAVAVTGDAGLLKNAVFTLHTVAGKPRDDSTATTALIAPAPSAGGLGITGTQTALVLGFAAVGAGALALARRPLREKALWAGVGLYTRLLRPDVLGHEERDRLYKLVETQPGIHFHALQRELHWNTGTLTYHLRVLEKHGFVVDRRDGPLRRFYISGAAPRKELFSQDAPHGLRADVLEAIRNRNGISQSDLALALGANKQTVNYHVKALEKQGVIRIEKRGRETFLHMSNAPSTGPAQPPGEARA